MSDFVLAFTNPAAADPKVSGSKGATLARMTAAGIAVPGGFVVTTRVFADVVGDRAAKIDQELQGVDFTDLEAVKDASDKARRAIRESELSSSVVSAISAAYDNLGSDGVAVRSSATAEDLSGMSFAGQYDSFLNVLPFERVIERLVDVWASLYSPRAIAYRLDHKVDAKDVHMAVVVQRQTRPQASGVLFTRNPITSTHQLVVNATLGLGESVVEGTSSSDQFAIDPATGKTIWSEVAIKETMIVTSPVGGTKEVPVSESQRNRPSLSSAHLLDLAALGKRVEGLLGGPQDIEFAVEDGALLCLQARPITGLELSEAPAVDWESHVDPKYAWQLSRMRTHLGPLYRLQQDAFEAYAEGGRACFQETGSGMSRNHVTQIVHGYPYTRSPDVDDATVEDRQERHAALCDAYADQGTSKYEQRIRPEVERILADLGRLRGGQATLQTRVAYLEAAMSAYGYVMGHLHWCQGSGSLRLDWPALFHELTGEPPHLAGVFLQAIPTTTTRMIAALRKLARVVQDDPQVSSTFAGRHYEEIESAASRSSPSFSAFRSGFRSLLRTHGFRTGGSYGSSSHFETPTWKMAPENPLDVIASYAEQDLDELDRLDADALTERRRHTRRIRRKLAVDPERLSRFESGRRRAQQDVVRMEGHNHLMEQCTVGHLYEAISQTGQALWKEGIIEAPTDVLHISMDELKQLTQDSNPQNLRPVVDRRSAERDERAKLRPPPATLGRPQAEQPASSSEEPDDAGLDGSVVRGTPASRGRATGPARVILSGEQPPRIERGDILVAENVGQDWTPVFPLLSALVLDQGALFQHAALVAREYRIPAVILTKDATTSIRDGQTITVDGDAGTIELDV